MPLPVFCLNLHASYRCRDRGVCCTSGWPIEGTHLLSTDPAELGTGLPAKTRQALAAWHRSVSADEASNAPIFLPQHDGACIFYDRDRPGCRVHATLGHHRLPLACRQFPRVTLMVPSGIRVTLSHYCPTAAARLETTEPARVLCDASAFPRDAEYVGLDARTELPPLLRPGMLMDWTDPFQMVTTWRTAER